MCDFWHYFWIIFCSFGQHRVNLIYMLHFVVYKTEHLLFMLSNYILIALLVYIIYTVWYIHDIKYLHNIFGFTFLCGLCHFAALMPIVQNETCIFVIFELSFV